MRVPKLWLPLLLLAAAVVPAGATVQPETAVVSDERLPSGVPLGGLGAGKVELFTDGTFGNLTLNNNWERPIPELPGSFFALRARSGKADTARVLALRSHYGFPSVSGVRYQGLFPKAQLRFSDPDLPLDVSLLAYSPLVPQNVKDSSLPAAGFTFTLSNPGSAPVEATLAFSWENALGRGGNGRAEWNDRTGNVQAAHSVEGRMGILFSTDQKQTGPRQNSIGQYALLAEADEGRVIPLPYWNAAGDGEDFWKSFTGKIPFGDFAAAQAGREGSVHPAGAVGVTVRIPPDGSAQVHFVLGWHMPSLVTTDGKDHGHAYAGDFPDAWSAASYAAQNREKLLAGTTEWQDLLLKSSLPGWLKVKLLNDLSPLSSNTVFARDGQFTMLEGVGENEGALGAMDQWLLSRGALGAFFPRLDREELGLFTALQARSGEPRRLLGTLTEGFGTADSPAGKGGQPDVACNYVLAVYRQFRSSGDLETLKAVFPSVERALDWLKTRDADGDGIPEGGSTWTSGPEQGTFSYTASLYLAALRAGEAMARVAGKRDQEDDLRDRYRQARATARAQLWNGRFFTKALDPVSGERSPAVFAGALAGEWAGYALGLPELYERPVVEAGLRGLLDQLSDPGLRLPPNEVRPDGQPEPGASTASWAGHLETFLGALGIVRNRADAALEIVRRVDEVQYSVAGSPWDSPLGYDARSGQPLGARSHVAAMGSWNVYTALTGFIPDEPGGRLTVAPNLPADWNGLHAPLFSPRFWAWADYGRTVNNASADLRVKLVRKFDERPLVLNGLTTTAPSGVKAEELTLLVTGPGGPIEGKAEITEGRLVYTFKAPFEWRLGVTIQATLVPPDANNLVVAFNPNRIYNYGSLVTARDLQKDKQVRFTLVNPTPERQVVNIRFRDPSSRNYEVFQNGTQLPRFTPDTEDERLSLVVPASPVGRERSERLSRALERLRAARAQAEREGKLEAVDRTLSPLADKIEAALRADETARSSQVVLHPLGNKLFGSKRFNKGLKEAPPAAAAADPEPAVAAAEEALDGAAKSVAEQVKDPAAQGLLLAALNPVRVEMEALDAPAPGGRMRLRVTFRNEGRRPVRASLALEYPQGWSGPASPARLRLEPGEADGVVVPVRLPEALEGRRYRVAGRATFSTGGTSWSAPVELQIGHGSIREWSVIGVWPAPQGVDEKLPPDTELEPAANYKGRRWRLVRSRSDRLDLASAFPEETKGVAYAFTQVFSSRDQEALLELAAGGSVVARMNGESVFQRKGAGGETERIPIRLRQGWNTLLLKLGRGADPWGFQAEITDRSGNTVPGLRYNPEVGK
jgi:uncharacterized protein (DUF608 family)